MNVIQINENFEFDGLSLLPPTGVQGGAYFSKLKMNGEKLYIQTPKCKTKGGIKKSGKKMYCDLMFENEDSEFYTWHETFEEKVKDLIYDHRSNWFHDDLEKEDIEYNWNSGVRSYKQKFYLFRTFIDKSKVSSKPLLKIFNEDEETLSIDDLNINDNMMCIFEVKGLKFTSQSFHLECMLIQILVLNEEENIFNKCLIKTGKKRSLEKPVKKVTLELKDEVTKDENMVELKHENAEEANTEEDNTEEANTEEANTEELNTEEVNDPEESNVNLVIHKEEDHVKNKLEEVSEETGILNENEDGEEEEEEDLEKNESLEENDEILEVNLELPKDLEINSMKLKKPNEVYYEMYKSAKNKAKLAKKLAIQAYLESKEIKKTYMLDNIDDDSDDDDLEKIIQKNDVLFDSN